MIFFWTLLFLVVSALFVEGATELLCKSVLFFKVRERIAKVGEFFNNLISCGFCTSYWIASLPSLVGCVLFYYHWALVPLQFIFSIVVFGRLSNYLHNFNDKHLDKYYDHRLKDR